MAKFFLVLTILLAGAAAFFGFQTKGKLDAVQTTVTKLKGDAASAKTAAQKAGDDLKVAQKQVSDANEKAAANEAAKSKAEADLTTANTALTDAKTQVTTLQGQIDELKKNAAPVDNGPKIAAPDPELTKKLQEAEAKAAEAGALVATLQSKVKEDEDKILTLSKAEEARKAQTMRPGLEGQVMAVNQGWNFVVISLGDRQGAVANASLIVKRGDTMIGRVKISSVEPSTSIADIVPDSVPKGQRVLPGDRVIFPVQ